MQDVSQSQDGEGGAVGVKGKAEKPAVLRIPGTLELGYVLADGHIEVPVLIDPWTRQPLTKSMCEAVMELHKEARRHHFAQRSVTARVARMEAEKVPEHAMVHQYPEEAADPVKKLASGLEPGDRILRDGGWWEVIRVAPHIPIGGIGEVFVACRRCNEVEIFELDMFSQVATIERR